MHAGRSRLSWHHLCKHSYMMDGGGGGFRGRGGGRGRGDFRGGGRGRGRGRGAGMDGMMDDGSGGHHREGFAPYDRGRGRGGGGGRGRGRGGATLPANGPYTIHITGYHPKTEQRELEEFLVQNCTSSLQPAPGYCSVRESVYLCTLCWWKLSTVGNSIFRFISLHVCCLCPFLCLPVRSRA